MKYIFFLIVTGLVGASAHGQVQYANGVYSQTDAGDLRLEGFGRSLSLTSLMPGLVDLSAVPGDFLPLHLNFLVDGGGLGKTPADFVFLVPSSQEKELRGVGLTWTLIAVETDPDVMMRARFSQSRRFADPFLGDSSSGLNLRLVRSLVWRLPNGETKSTRFTWSKELLETIRTTRL